MECGIKVPPISSEGGDQEAIKETAASLFTMCEAHLLKLGKDNNCISSIYRISRKTQIYKQGWK